MTARAWRNNNPLNLRTLPMGQQWRGQAGVDNGPGGPFAIFASASDGWAAGYTNLLAYQDRHDLYTISEIVHRWAPSSDSNNERAYAEALAKRCNVSPDQRLDLHDAVVLRRLGDAMARVEAGEDLPWSEDDKDTALKSVGMVVPPPPPEPAVARTPVASTPGRDQLVQDSHTLQGFINGAKQSDPELWHRLSDKPLAMSRTVWGSFLSMVVSWAVTRYGLDLDSDTCAVISGAIVLAVTGVIRRYSVGGVSGILKATPANPP